jgi:aminoglycoside 3-N-acetyltransferase VI
MTQDFASAQEKDGSSRLRQIPMTRPALVQQLRDIGVRSGDTLMPHVSLRAVGPLDGGPRTLVGALLEAIGPGGNLLAFVSWRDSPYEETLGKASVPIEIANRWPPFDPGTAPAYPGFGAINEFIRTHPGTYRSAHPDASMAAIGPYAEWLTTPHRLGEAYGPGSPVERFLQLDGRVLLIGAGPDAVTTLHYAEAVAGIAGKRRVTYSMPLREAGGTRWVTCSDWDSNGILNEYAAPEGPDAVERIARDYLAQGYATEGEVGAARSRLISARDIVAHGVAWLEARHPRQGEPGALPPTHCSATSLAHDTPKGDRR